MNPVCVFWNESASGGQWSRVGVNSLSVNQIRSGEIKQYSVRCNSNHLTAFGIAVDVDTSVRF